MGGASPAFLRLFSSNYLFFVSTVGFYSHAILSLHRHKYVIHIAYCVEVEIFVSIISAKIKT